MRRFIQRHIVRFCVCAAGLLGVGVARAADQASAGPVPVPEPPVIAMLLSAGMVGGFFYLRQKRKQLAAERRRGKYGDANS